MKGLTTRLVSKSKRRWHVTSIVKQIICYKYNLAGEKIPEYKKVRAVVGHIVEVAPNSYHATLGEYATASETTKHPSLNHAHKHLDELWVVQQVINRMEKAA